MTRVPPADAGGPPPPEPPPLPGPLADALRARDDGAELAAVWAQLGDTTPPARGAEAEARRAEAWARVAAATGVPVDARRPSAARPAPPPATRPLPPAWVARPTTRRPAPARARWLVAAGLLLAVATGGALVTSARAVEVTAAPGARSAVTLPDGSRAELNAGSTLRYARAFGRWPAGRVRRVRLDGQAFFAVTRGGAPFVVETADARVTVLGTRFDVRARGGATEVTVEEGRVRVAAAGAPDRAATLAAGQATLVAGPAAAPAPVRTAPVAQLVAWRTGGFAAVDQPLASVLDEIARRHAVDVTLRTPAAADDRVTLYYPRPASAEAILADLCAAKGLRYRRTSRGFEVL